MALIANCACCASSQVDVLNEALLAGEPSHLLAQQYGLRVADITRHKRAHLLKERGRATTPLDGAPKPAELRRR